MISRDVNESRRFLFPLLVKSYSQIGSRTRTRRACNEVDEEESEADGQGKS